MSFTDSVTDLVAKNPNGLLAAHPTWTRVTLGSVFEVQNGFPFESKHFNANGNGWPLLRIRDVKRGETETWYDGAVDEAFVVRPGDFVIGMDGDFNARPWRGPPALLNQRVCRLIPKGGGYSAALLAHVIQGYLDAINAKTSSITVKHLSSRTIEEIPLPLPPEGEQLRLAEAIDSYLSRLDAAVANLERVQAKLKAYRASVLKAAVEGRLVPTEAEVARQEKRDYEPAEALLARILKDRRRRWEEAELARLKKAGKAPKDDKWKAKYEEPSPPDTSKLPELPEGWCWASADALCDAQDSITYGVIKLGDEVIGGVPTLRSSNVRSLRLDLDYVKAISEEIARQYRRTKLQGGEVVVTVRGTLGGVAVVPDSCIGFNVSREVAVMRLVDVRLGPTVAALIASPGLDAWIRRNTKGNTYVGINIEDLKRLPVPLPPLAEQPRISEGVDVNLGVVDHVSQQCAVELRRIERLRQAILKWAFEGKLVDQDPNDEPAEKLLARIRAERGAGSTKPRSAKRGKVMRRQKDKRPPADALRANGKPMTPEELLEACGYDADSVEPFFAALHVAVTSGEIVEERPDKTHVLLRAGRA